MNILVTGVGFGTLGWCIAEDLKFRGHNVIRWGRDVEADYQVDLTKISEVVNGYMETQPTIDGIVNCAGANQMAEFESLSISDARELMELNLWGSVRMVQEFLPDLEHTEGFVCNIISNASHVPMTHSLAYNASKAALDIATKQMARELTPKSNITVFGISPVKIAGTRMSEYIDKTVPIMRGWSDKAAREYQLNSLLRKQEIPKQDVASFVGLLLSQPNVWRWLSGCVLPYGA